MPPSCVEERRRVFNKAYAADSPLVIRDLSKQYENGKQALLGLNLVVEKGECLGYLGPNGSGKTTTMGLLSGALQPSHGTALIGGKDIQKDSQAARLLSGVCPQFSVLWDELTVTEHMLFYARLKGVHIAEEWDHVQSLLRCVGLRRYQNRLASQLSGGMQRRLSVAISLCGDPSIVILDEPTTGLDPLSRKELWKMLLRARKGRAILLTTHAMEEAQMLCTRIAVLLGGKLQCVGTQQQLLDQLGIGYQLTVRYEVHLAAQVLQYIMEAAPTAEVAYQWRHVTTFWLPVSTRPSQTFKLMNECPPEGLLNWSVSHVGLDELFASIVDGHEAIEGPMV
jgi:ABC-type multidrug transport system ATPase subunit